MQGGGRQNGAQEIGKLYCQPKEETWLTVKKRARDLAGGAGTAARSNEAGRQGAIGSRGGGQSGREEFKMLFKFYRCGARDIGDSVLFLR